MISEKPVTPGDVLVVTLPSHNPWGREQEGRRPAVVVGVPSGKVRFPVVVVVPLTTQDGAWAQDNPMLYPSLAPGQGCLPRYSVALLDQVRATDIRRVEGYLGTLAADDYECIRAGLRQMLRL